MGGNSSKPAAPPGPPPPLSAEAVEALCRDAYAAGTSDADMYYASEREVLRRQGAIAGAGTCLLSAWMAYVYGRTVGTRAADDAASLRLDAQRQVLDKTSKDLALALEENRSLATMRQEQDVALAVQREELARAAQQRRAMQHSMQTLSRRNARVQRRMRRLEASLAGLQRQVLVGAAGVGLALLVGMLATRRLRHRAPPPPAVLQESVVAAAATPAKAQEEAES